MNRNEGVDYWHDRKKFFEDGCPFCGDAVFLEGPHGSENINFKCTECGATFNDKGFDGIELLTNPENEEVLLIPPDEAA